MDKIKSLYEKYKEIIIYIIFGVATTIVNLSVYSAVTKVFGIDDNNETMITVANGVAWFFAMIFAFFTNKKYVFKSKSFKLNVILKEGASFFGSRLVSGIVEVSLPTLLIFLGLRQSFLSIQGFWAKALSSVLVIILNFFFTKYLVFGKKKDKKQS